MWHFTSFCSKLQLVSFLAGNLVTVVALMKCAKLRTHATTTFVIRLDNLYLETIATERFWSRYHAMLLKLFESEMDKLCRLLQ